MKRGAYFINVGRGRLVVEEDLLAALDSGQLSGAALDVFRTEPLPADSRLWTHPKVVVTPHAAGGVTAGLARRTSPRTTGDSWPAGRSSTSLIPREDIDTCMIASGAAGDASREGR